MLGFRVWDKREKKFLSTIEERRKITLFDDGTLSLCNHEPLSDEDLSRYIPMQSTGLLDIDNKEIFEGDIVHEIRIERIGLNETPKIVTVVYSASKYLTLMWGEGNSFKLKLLGNIYENPELLMKNKV